ncbi:MAG: M48 family metallopeptidase [Firmicutes bacterium]|nr:M48 family metallopeptidase [Bacillota bacterium]MBQ5437834.1 M48 family metallopeptidase [Bacillota bacterium]
MRSAFGYEVIRSRRRTVSAEVKPDGRVVIRAPLFMSSAEIDRFVRQKQDWIERHVSLQKKRMAAWKDGSGNTAPPLTDDQLEVLKKAARAKLPKRTAELAKVMGISYGRVSVRAQKSRWGSCSSAGNINLNCLLMLAPDRVQDYVIIHELAHRRHMDHSPRFWALVAAYCPDHADCRRWLRDYGSGLISRLP